MGPGLSENSCVLEGDWASLVAQLVKDPPAMWETWVWSPGWQDPLEKGKSTHSSILTWRLPWTIYSMGSQRVGHDWVTFTLTETGGMNFLPAPTERRFRPSYWWFPVWAQVKNHGWDLITVSNQSSRNEVRLLFTTWSCILRVWRLEFGCGGGGAGAWFSTYHSGLCYISMVL